MPTSCSGIPTAASSTRARCAASTRWSTCAASTSAAKRWSGAFKQSLRDSRIDPTEVLSDAVVEAGVRALINASAVGYYGDTGNRIATKPHPPGSGFLAQLCRDWEAATAARAAGGRSGRADAHRAGAVAARRHAQPAASRCSRSGLGARLGNGRQYMPWISLEDEVRALLFAISHDELSGPVNLTGPAPVTNAEFTAAHRPDGEPADAADGARIRVAHTAG